jgi:4'-phosphopantetheinyl transferase EntD
MFVDGPSSGGACSRRMMAGLVPEVVVVRESDDPASWTPSDWPEEQAAVAKAVERRQLEHGTVRRLARAAMAELGVAPAPLLTGEKREPLWPPGVVGSLTHCRGYCAAAVALDTQVRSVGIDAEPDERLRESLVDRLCHPAEVERLDWFDADPGMRGKAIFCIKEAIYKVWYPVAGRWLGFLDVDVSAASSGAFTATVLVDAPPELTTVSGRFERADGFVRAAATALARQP